MTTANLYCSPQDLYRYGLPRGFLTNPGRTVAAVHTSTDALELDGHGFGDSADRTPVTFRAEAGGSLPAELAEGTTYYGEALTEGLFQVYAAAAGGSPIGLSTAGANVVVNTSLPVLEVIERYSRFADGRIPAQAVPLEVPIPVTVVAIVAELSSQRLLWISGQKSIQMAEIEAAAHKELLALAPGIPLRDARATAPTNLAVSENVAASGRGWVVSSGGVEVLP